MMKIKRMIALLMALVLAMAMGCAAAEEALGNLPSRGMRFPMTQEDVELGIELTAYADVYDDEGNPQVFAAVLSYCSPVYFQLEGEFYAMYESGDFERYDELMEKLIAHYHNIARFYLVADEEEIALVKADDPNAEVLCENDGYTYLIALYDLEPAEDEDKALFEAADARIRELVQQVSFQPVELTEEDLAEEPETVVPNAFPAFTTELLTGGTVDNSVFADKDLTIVNIWGTFCMPCISEMPELEAWSKELPENVQIVGLVCDAAADSEDDVETAMMICESTGVTYPNWLYCEDFEEMLAGMPFVPTTIFVDRSGAIVGEPICGAYVELYKEFVSNYINAL